MLLASPRDLAGQLPRSPGVYRFRDAQGRVLYIGRATELRSRVRSYWGDLRERGHLRRMVAQIDRVEAVACDSAHEAAWLERNLMERSKPRWNRTAGGQEVPVYVRLQTDPSAPGLSVIHQVQPADGVLYFGPYLGGVRVRLAVAALHRIFPVSYTGSRLRGAERDMAGERGVSAVDREHLLDSLGALLRRDPATVAHARIDLARRRDRVAESLAFELAARIQAELEALEWITCTQRVTSAEPTDFEIAGWADGLLVQFRFRKGRLNEWTQRACGEQRAAEHLAGTPEVWSDFAQRNAALAVTLRNHQPGTAGATAATARAGG